MKNTVMILSIVSLVTCTLHAMDSRRRMDFSHLNKLAQAMKKREEDATQAGQQGLIAAAAPVAPQPYAAAAAGPVPVAPRPQFIPAPRPQQMPAPQTHAAAPAPRPVSAAPRPVAPATRECPICMDDKALTDFCRLSCGHEFCRACLSRPLEIAVRERNTTTLRCSNPACRHTFDEADIKNIVHDPALMRALRDAQFQEWAAKNPNLRQCPTADCPYLFEYDENPRTIMCPVCNQQYCANCRSAHLQEITCAQAEQDRTLAADPRAEARASEQLIQNTTKRCPRCHANIERSAGCNHMTCANCHHEFCWLCMIDWPGYGAHACPTYGDAVAPAVVPFAPAVPAAPAPVFPGLFYGEQR